MIVSCYQISTRRAFQNSNISIINTASTGTNHIDKVYCKNNKIKIFSLTKDYDLAEKFLKNALLIMPGDPIVNDHYGDVMWQLDMKLQARYYWNAALSSDEVEEKLIEDINDKLLFGLKNL